MLPGNENTNRAVRRQRSVDFLRYCLIVIKRSFSGSGLLLRTSDRARAACLWISRGPLLTPLCGKTLNEAIESESNFIFDFGPEPKLTLVSRENCVVKKGFSRKIGSEKQE